MRSAPSLSAVAGSTAGQPSPPGSLDSAPPAPTSGTFLRGTRDEVGQRALEMAAQTTPVQSPLGVMNGPMAPGKRDVPPTAHPKNQVPYIVLVGLDLSEPGGRAWRFAFDLAALRGEAEIHAVVIGQQRFAPLVRDIATPDVTHHHSDEQVNMPPLKVLQHRSAGGRARLMAMHFRTGRPERAIVRLAQELGADLIVVAGHPTTLVEWLLGGSISDRIARKAPCPVVVVKPKRDGDHDVVEYEPRQN